MILFFLSISFFPVFHSAFPFPSETTFFFPSPFFSFFLRWQPLHVRPFRQRHFTGLRPVYASVRFFFPPPRPCLTEPLLRYLSSHAFFLWRPPSPLCTAKASPLNQIFSAVLLFGALLVIQVVVGDPSQGVLASILPSTVVPMRILQPF